MKKYSPKEAVQWDAWFVNRQTKDGVETHAFYLKNGPLTPNADPRIGWEVGHAVTRDGFAWDTLADVLPPLYDENDPEDFHTKFTGCAVNRDDVCYLFYTMRAKDRTSQRIGVAISNDWIHFERYAGNPVIVNQDSYPIPVATRDGSECYATLIGYSTLQHYDWNIVDARDLIVVERDNTDGKGIYSGYYAAAADVGNPCPTGVIVMLRSNDLLHWTDPCVVYEVDHLGVLEVPDVFCMDGKWVLTCLTGMNYSGRAVTRDPYSNNATIVAYADRPEGPFLEVEEDNILLAGPAQSGFTCRSYTAGKHNEERHLVYIDRAGLSHVEGGTECHTALSLPKRLQMQNGRLRPLYLPLPERYLGELLSLSSWSNEQNSFAWRTFGGTTQWENGTLTLQTTSKDYHAASIVLPETVAAEGSVMLCADVRLDGNGGLFLRSARCPYVLLFEPKESRIALYRLYSFDPLGARSMPIEQGRCYRLRCILIDGVIELYVDDVLIFQRGIPTGNLTHLGFVSDRGTLTAQNISVQPLL